MKDSTGIALAGCIFVLSLIVAVLALNIGIAFGLALLVHLACPEISFFQAFAAGVVGMVIGLLFAAFKHR